MWGHISRSDPKPKDDEKKRAKWNTKDAKIKTWILGSVEPHFIINLRLHKTAQEMWRYLTKKKKKLLTLEAISCVSINQSLKLLNTRKKLSVSKIMENI